MELQEQWNSFIGGLSSLYIYGAGKIGRKLLRLIQHTKNDVTIKGFLVSDRKGNPDYIEHISVMTPDMIEDRDTPVLVAVSDMYQELILKLLKTYAYTNVYVAYRYTYLWNDTEEKRSCSFMVDTHELLLCQFVNGVFNRYDTIVRLMAAESYYGKCGKGMDVYIKMQNCRENSENNYGELSCGRFTALMDSFKEKGYDDASEIIVDEDLRLIDGSHRLALGIYFNIPRLRIRVLRQHMDIKYGREWFEDFFYEEEIKEVERKVEELMPSWFHPIKIILWSSVEGYFDEIVSEVEQDYRVANVQDYEFEWEEFESLVKEIYAIDSIALWKVETKLKYLKNFFPYKVRTFDVDMGNPQFRLSGAGNSILSDKGAALKEAIRSRYKNKVNNYFSDIIVHSGDGFYQSRYINELFNGYKEKCCGGRP